MTVISIASGTEIPALPKGCSVALGFFDGVHIGHRAILREATRHARIMDSSSAVWMISSHGSNKARSPLLTDDKEKLALMGACGIDFAVLASFEEIRNLSGEEFVRCVLAEKLGAAAAVCGFNFRFGKGAAWGMDDLSRLCRAAGITQITVPAVTYDGESVSSSRIRQLIVRGDMESAAVLLGRPFYFRLPVLGGKMLGRTLGFPTANQLPPPYLMCPPRGVYATEVELSDNNGEVKYYPGSTNIGVCPTVTDEVLADSGLQNDAAGAANGHRAVAETYIEGFEGDLYGQVIKVSFLRRIRGEMKFPSVDALTAQIRRDSETAREEFMMYKSERSEQK